MKGEDVVKEYVAKYGRKNVNSADADDAETTTEESISHLISGSSHNDEDTPSGSVEGRHP